MRVVGHEVVNSRGQRRNQNRAIVRVLWNVMAQCARLNQDCAAKDPRLRQNCKSFGETQVFNEHAADFGENRAAAETRQEARRVASSIRSAPPPRIASATYTLVSKKTFTFRDEHH